VRRCLNGDRWEARCLAGYPLSLRREVRTCAARRGSGATRPGGSVSRRRTGATGALLSGRSVAGGSVVDLERKKSEMLGLRDLVVAGLAKLIGKRRRGGNKPIEDDHRAVAARRGALDDRPWLDARDANEPSLRLKTGVHDQVIDSNVHVLIGPHAGPRAGGAERRANAQPSSKLPLAMHISTANRQTTL
jgi:hypothetical protein